MKSIAIAGAINGFFSPSGAVSAALARQERSVRFFHFSSKKRKRRRRLLFPEIHFVFSGQTQRKVATHCALGNSIVSGIIPILSDLSLVAQVVSVVLDL